MSIPNDRPTSSSATGQDPRFKWLIQLANAAVITLGIFSGYSLAMGHHESMSAAQATQPSVHSEKRKGSDTPACQPERAAQRAAR